MCLKCPPKRSFPPAPDPAALGTSAAIYLQGIQPLMAYLGGPLDNTDGWVAKDHIFTAGNTVRKSVVLLNDGRTPQPYTIEWTANDAAGNPLHTKTLHGTLAIGEKAFLPIEFPAPDVDDKTDLTIKLAATFGPPEKPLTLTDATTVRILPTLPALEKPRRS